MGEAGQEGGRGQEAEGAVVGGEEEGGRGVGDAEMRAGRREG